MDPPERIRAKLALLNVLSWRLAGSTSKLEEIFSPGCHYSDNDVAEHR